MSEQTLAAPIDDTQERGFSRYQSYLVALLAFVQFTIILDFIIMSPLGAILMPALDITASQFGVAVSAYAFSAAISGVLAAGFAGFTYESLEESAARDTGHIIVARREYFQRDEEVPLQYGIDNYPQLRQRLLADADVQRAYLGL